MHNYTDSSKRREVFLLSLALIGVLMSAAACARVDKAEEAGRPVAATVLIRPTASRVAGPSMADNTVPRPPATFTVVPTLTSPVTPAQTSLPSTPIVLMSEFGKTKNRLTGELVDDPSVLQRRPIAVKISNAPARWTRPQSGLSEADLVFEHLTEGSITRFTAVFYGSTPAKVGPIRSARLIDLELLAMYDAALAYSGSSIGVSHKLFDSDFRTRILRTNTPGYFRTGENKPYEHTLYATPAQLWETLSERGENREPLFDSAMAFSQLPPEDGRPAQSATVRYRDFSTIEWRYDQKSGRYLRWSDGQEHLDANNGNQIGASNVVVLFAPHEQDPTICEYQREGRCLAFSTEIALLGEGKAILLRDGRAYEVMWQRITRHQMLAFVDERGEPFPMQIGKTWFQVVPTDYPEAYSLGPQR